MQIYLPIADLPVDILVVLGMGLAVGFISGMFGIGGGFLMTPLLIFIGISPAVAVASVASHIAASSCSGALNYWRRRAVDLALGLMLLAGGILGTAVGVWLFTVLRSLGQLDLTIGVSYVVLLSHGRRPDDQRERARHHARAAGQAGDAAAGRQPHLAARAAAEDAVQALQDLCVGDPGLADRLHHRLRRRDHGHRRRLPAGADADLFPAGADRDRDRHLDDADAHHHGVGHRHARRHQPPGRRRAGADPDDRRGDRRAVRRARRPEHARRTAAAAARAPGARGRSALCVSSWWCSRATSIRSAAGWAHERRHALALAVLPAAAGPEPARRPSGW